MLITFFNIILYAMYASSVPAMHTTSVVVHSCLQLRLIRYEWGASFFNVGASFKHCSRRLQRIKLCGSFGPKADKLLEGLEQILPHNTYSRTAKLLSIMKHSILMQLNSLIAAIGFVMNIVTCVMR